MKDILVYLILGMYVYGWWLIFFSKKNFEEENEQ